jgi:hypothetical protein
MTRRSRYFEAEAQLFAEVLIEGVRADAFARKDAKQSASTLLLATNALLPYSLSAHELGTREEVEYWASRIADMLLDGLRRRDRSDN